jgi:hypothetical protein
MAAHLSSSEDYNLSTLDGSREAYIAAGVAAGAHDLASFNDWGVRTRAEWPATAVVDEMREKSALTRAGLRERGDREIDTMAGSYPARLQAFHLAFEAAIHNDDMDVPIDDSEQVTRDTWRAAVARFMLVEEGRPVELGAVAGGTRVRHVGTGDEATLTDADLVRAASGRLGDRAARYPRSVVEGLATAG